MKVMDALRQTGRTTRMMNKAIQMARDFNQEVSVIFAHPMEIDTAKRIVGLIKCDNLKFINYKDAGDLIDLQTLLPLKGGEGKLIFIDHGVIEAKFNHFVMLLHHYDESLRFDLSMIDMATLNNDSNRINHFSQILTVKLKK